MTATSLPGHLVPPRAIADGLASADEDYVRSHFVPLAEVAGHRLVEVRDAIAAGRLPAPAYLLDDGTEMVAPDYLAFPDQAGDDLEATFKDRVAAAGLDADAEWSDYLSGVYAVCLRTVTPETIVRKTRLVEEIEGLLADARPRDPHWRGALRAAIDALDELERLFAPLDEHRLGKRPTRRRLIEDPRERWPWLRS